MRVGLQGFPRKEKLYYPIREFLYINCIKERGTIANKSCRF